MALLEADEEVRADATEALLRLRRRLATNYFMTEETPEAGQRLSNVMSEALPTVRAAIAALPDDHSAHHSAVARVLMLVLNLQDATNFRALLLTNWGQPTRALACMAGTAYTLRALAPSVAAACQFGDELVAAEQASSSVRRAGHDWAICRALWLAWQGLLVVGQYYEGQLWAVLAKRPAAALAIAATLRAQQTWSMVQQGPIEAAAIRQAQEITHHHMYAASLAGIGPEGTPFTRVDAQEWATNAAQLAGVYRDANAWEAAAGCLAAADAVLGTATDAELAGAASDDLAESRARQAMQWGMHHAACLSTAREWQLAERNGEPVDKAAHPPSDLTAPQLEEEDAGAVPNPELARAEAAALATAHVPVHGLPCAWDSPFQGLLEAMGAAVPQHAHPDSVRSYDMAREVFKAANTALLAAAEVLVLDGFVTENIAIVRARASLYKSVAWWESDPKRVAAMLERRLVLAGPLLDVLNPAIYIVEQRDIAVECAGAAQELAELRMEMAKARRDAGKPVSDKAVREINRSIAQACGLYHHFLRSYDEPRLRGDGRIPELPASALPPVLSTWGEEAESTYAGCTRFAGDNVNAPMLGATELPPGSAEVFCSLLHAIARNLTRRVCAGLQERKDSLSAALVRYQWLVRQAPTLLQGCPAGTFSTELDFAQQLCELLPAQIARLDAGNDVAPVL